MVKRHVHNMLAASLALGTVLFSSAAYAGNVTNVNPDTGKPGGKYIYHDIKAKTISGSVYSANTDNPLAKASWAVNNGFWDNPYQRTGGVSNTTAAGGVIDDYENNRSLSSADRSQLYKFVGQPRSIFFTPKNSPASEMNSDSTASQHKDSIAMYFKQMKDAYGADAMVQVSLFAIFTVGGGENNTAALTAEQKNTYNNWMANVSKAIKNSGLNRVAVIMEPDAAMLSDETGTTYKDKATRRGMINNAVKLLSENSNASIYIDAGSADWLDARGKIRPQGAATNAVKLLRQLGIQYARGCALGATHFDGTADNILYAKDISDTLAKQGYANIKAVIDTADNGYNGGKGYTHAQWSNGGLGKIPTSGGGTGGSSYDDQRLANGTYVSALGVQPTWRVGDAIPTTSNAGKYLQATAIKYVDGYLWFGRPEINNNAYGYNGAKALVTAKASADKTAD